MVPNSLSDSASLLMLLHAPGPKCVATDTDVSGDTIHVYPAFSHKCGNLLISSRTAKLEETWRICCDGQSMQITDDIDIAALINRLTIIVTVDAICKNDCVKFDELH